MRIHISFPYSTVGERHSDRTTNEATPTVGVEEAEVGTRIGCNTKTIIDSCSGAASTTTNAAFSSCDCRSISIAKYTRTANNARSIARCGDAGGNETSHYDSTAELYRCTNARLKCTN